MEPDIKELAERIEKIEDILFSIGDDPRFKAKIRKQIFDGEHATGKPKVINENGKVYKLDIV